jgi:dihydropyrimidinase
MHKMDLVVKNGTIVTASDIYQADIGVEGEKVALVGHGLSGREVVDATGHYVFPGFVDAHVHLSLPVGGIVSSDDFITGTIAAACGGTTTVLDFITPLPGQSLRKATAARRQEADGQVAIDYGLHLTAIDASPETLAALPGLAAQGYTSLKLYTTYDMRLNDDQFLRLLAAARECGLLPLVHTENHAAVEYLKAKFQAEGRTEPRYHPLSRPPVVEAEAANRVLTLASLTGTPVCIAHLTCRETLATVEWARARGQAVYAEVCPQHLLLSIDDYDRPGFEGAKFVLSPPLRDRSHWQPLWQALANGGLQAVSSDHCPWTWEQKQLGRDDFTQIPSGAPGIETRVPLIYGEGVGKGRLSLNRFVEVCATGPARLFGLFPQKGTVAVGSDADLVLWDPNKEHQLTAENLHTGVDYSPYEDITVRGYPTLVLQRGKVIVRNNEFVGEVGAGRFLKRNPIRLWPPTGPGQ